MLEAILNSPKILGLASGRLKKVFADEGLISIVIQRDDSVQDGMLPGFRLDMYKRPTVVLFETDYDRLAEEMTAKPHMLTNEEFAEYQSLKNKSNVNGEFQAGDAGEPASAGAVNSDIRDPAY